MTSVPKLTVAVPTRQRRDKVLALARDVLLQFREGDELIVSDNASSDGTAEALAGLSGVCVHRQKTDLGMVGNWNYCMSTGSHEWVCVIHDDDRLLPGGLDAIRRVCAEAGGPALVAHSAWQPHDLQGDNRSLWYETREPGSRACLQAEFCPSGVTIHRSIVESAGGFSDQYPYSSDMEFFARICAKYPSYVIHAPLIVQYVLHDENLQYGTWRRPDFFQQLEKVERALIDHAGLDKNAAETLLQARYAGQLLYILDAARRIADAGLVRAVCRQMRSMRGLGRRRMFAAWLGSKLGWYPKRLVH